MVEKNRVKLEKEPKPQNVGNDLHAHISGSISASSICDVIFQNGLHVDHKDKINSIAQNFGLRLADSISDNLDTAKEQFTAVYACSPNGKNRFEEVMQRFNLTSFLLKFPGIKSQVGEVVTKDFKKNGVKYVEWRVDPFSGTTNESAEEGFEKLSEYYSGMKKVNLKSRFILSVSKSRYKNSEGVNIKKIEFLTEQVDKIVTFGKEIPIVGLDVSGAESVPVSFFEPYFDLAKAHNLGIVPHVGEGTNSTLEESLDDVEFALNFGATRLGHAIVAYLPLDSYLNQEDQHGIEYDERRIKRLQGKQEDILQRLKEISVPIEVCPTSNLSAHLGLRRLEDHPINRLVELGVPFVVCTDDGGIFGRTLREEIIDLSQAKNLNPKQIIESARKYSLSK